MVPTESKQKKDYFSVIKLTYVQVNQKPDKLGLLLL